MKEKIILYNHFHNGDVFYSRALMQILIEKYDITYYHNLQKSLFSDIPDVVEITGIPKHMNQNETYVSNGIINTWIGQGDAQYLKGNDNGCSFHNYFKLVRDVLNKLNLKSNTIYDHLPIINFQNLPQQKSISEELRSIKLSSKKVILISNGNVHSGQSPNFDMTNTILNLAKNNLDCTFIITHSIDNSCNNIIDVNQITKIRPDLLQIGLVSTFCDIIVGRASGPHCFTHTKENLLDNQKTFISFTNNPNEGKWFLESASKQVWTNNFDENNIYKIINEEINLK